MGILKRQGMRIAKYGISLAILSWLFWRTWRAGQFSLLWEGEKQWGWLAVALAAGCTVCLVSYFRWFLLGRALDLDFRLVDAVRLGFLGNFLNLMSFGVLGGDAVKALFLARRMPGRGPEAFASVVFDRALGLMTMFGFAGVAWLFASFPDGGAANDTGKAAVDVVCLFSLVASASGLVGLGVLFLTPRFTKTSFYRRVARWPRVGSLFKRLVAVGLAYRYRFNAVILALGLSVVVNLLFAVTIYAVASGLSPRNPTFGQHLVLSPISMVANAAPLPGGLGGMEAALSFLYTAFARDGMSGEHGFLVAIGFRCILLITAAIGLGVYLTGLREWRSLSKEKPEVNERG